MPLEFFLRIDDSDDELFYSTPRLVVHIDDGAIAKVSDIYAQLLPQGGMILDLMSSWRSHLPAHLRPSRVVGLGMNRPEMENNPALNEIVIHNLNREPRLPFNDAEFDAAVVTVSIQYMIRPLEVFAEVGRILKPGAPFVVTYSNRMFPTKAIAVWQHLDDYDRSKLVARYFIEGGRFENMDFIDKSEPTSPPSDPIWAVVGYRTLEVNP
ncbi:class I SAM-dependent methyltransferase [Candidatus Binatus sp.]|uniref:class I SAM-dependent methyltransferase n=1 Tax=Candidatus Binatus sp. TaxID=2811406 RepID=UPI00272CF5C4|nr:methyltransferase domain-containing protein [Candidatus Binatus sp.]